MSGRVESGEWAAVYEANSARLIRLATVLVGPDEAHDLVADAVMRAVTSSSWVRVDAQAAYLSRVTVNLANDRRSQISQRVRRELTAARLSPRGSASGPDLDIERTLLVRAALSSLSAGQLGVIHLHYWEDMSLAEVAEHLGLRPGTVRRQLDRAKRRLRHQLTAEGTK